MLNYTSTSGGIYYLGVSSDGNEAYQAYYGGSGTSRNTFQYELELNRDYGGGAASEIVVLGDVTGSYELEDGIGTIDFGNVAVGGASRRTFYIQNIGDGELVVSSFTPPSGYSLVGTSEPLTIPANSQRAVVLELSGTTPGTRNGTLVINSNDSNEAAYSIALTGLINPPALDAVNDTIGGIVPGSNISLDVLGNDIHIDGTITSVTAVNGETVTIAADGKSLDFIAPADFEEAVFLYTISDGFTTETATVTLTANLDPTAEADVVTGIEAGMEVYLYVLDNDFDADGDEITISSVGSSTQGYVEVHGSYLIYQAKAGFTGETFEYTITDSAGNTSTSTVTLSAPESAQSSLEIDWDRLSDVTPSMGVNYRQTSFHKSQDMLYAGLDLENVGTYAIRGPVLLGVKNLDNPNVVVQGHNGISPGGIPYYNITDLVVDDASDQFEPGETAAGLELQFYNPSGEQFRYELVFLSLLNEAPEFVSTPVTQVVEGATYQYHADAMDPDQDNVTYSLVSGPDGMSVFASSGIVQWDTASGDKGTYPIVIRATDPFGAYTDQQYTLEVVQTGNRPPRFTSFAETDAYVNTPYRYQLAATDPDSDPLTYLLVEGEFPAGMTLEDATRGLVKWTPTADQVDQTHTVMVKVSDGNGGEAFQTFDVYVNPEPGNTPPVIVSEPSTQLILPEIMAGNSTGDVSPISIDIALENGETITQTVNLVLDEEGVLGADIVFVVDESGSMSSYHDWLQNMVLSLDSFLVAQGVTDNRYSLVGYGEAEGGGSSSQGEYRLHVSPETMPSLSDFGDTISTAYGVTVSAGSGLRLAGDIGDGSHSSLDVDMFQVTLNSYDELFIDLDALTLDDGTSLSSFDGTIRVFNDQGDVVASSSDDYGGYSGYGGYGGVPDGDDDFLRFTNYGSTGNFYIGISGEENYDYDPSTDASGYGGSTGDYEILLSVKGSTGTDIGDTTSAAQALSQPSDGGIIAHRTQGNGSYGENDVDMYSLDLTSGERVVIDIDSLDDPDGYGGYGGGIDTLLRVFDASGNEVASNLRVATGYSDPQLTFEAPSTGTYYIGVSSAQNAVYDPYVADSGPHDPYLGHVFSTTSGDGWGSASEISDLTSSLEISGGTEDGYSGISTALNSLSYRSAASSHVILITDEDRDNIISSITFGSLLDDLEEGGVTLHSVVSADFEDGNSQVALGGSADGTAYLEGASGTFTESVGLDVAYASENTEIDYIDLSFQNNGTVWSLYELSQGGNTAVSFTNAFVDVMTTTVLEDLTIDLLVTDAGVSVVNLTGAQSATGETILSFDVLITGDGNAHAFDLQFVRASNPSVVIGSIPVTITTGYRYDVDAVDADLDELTYELVGQTHGATIDPLTGKLSWQPSTPGSYEFTAKVTDGRGGEDLQTWTVDVLSPSAANADPVFQTVPAKTWDADRDYTLDVTATDADGDTVLYRLVDNESGGMPLPSGMTIDQLTGRITWSPTVDQVGTHQVQVQAIDGRGGSATLVLSIDVSLPDGYGNERPEITSTPVLAAIESETYRYDAIAVDADDDTLTFDLPYAPEGMAIDPVTGRIAWIPTSDQIGSHTVYVRVKDGQGGIDLQTFNVTVASFNDAPQFVSVPQGGAAIGEAFQYQAEAIDPNGDVVTYSLDADSIAAGLSIGVTSGLLVWSSPTGGNQRVTITASDGRGKEAVQEFILSVNTNAPPTITSIPTGPAFIGQPYSYDITYDDPNQSDVVTLSLDQISQDRGMVLVGDQLQWTPTSLGDFEVAVTATDNSGAYYTQTFTLSVVAQTVASQPPEFTSTPTGPAWVGSSWSYELTASDPDGDSFTFSLGNGPTGMSLVGSTLSWTPSAVTYGESVEIKVEDQHGAYSTQTFQLPAVAPPVSNDPPVITSFPTGPAITGKRFHYQVAAHDPNGDVLNYSIDSAAEADGIEIDSETGALTWIPGSSGSYPITITVNDGTDTTTQSFTLPVVDPLPNNEYPEITSTPTGPAVENSLYEYQVIATDADGDALAYTLVSPPSGMTIDNETGLLTWTPTTSGDYTVTITVDDGNGGVTEQEFILPVVATTPANDPPVIRSAPLSSVRLNKGYSYQVDAYDPDGDSLSYELTSAPAGMQIDENGRVTWSPQVLGSFDVEITVSDGHGNSAIQSYTIAVQSPVAANLAPKFTSSPTGPAVRDKAYVYQVAASDPEGQAITYALDAASIALGMSIDSQTGLLTWTPATSDKVHIEITASDGQLATKQSFDLAVVDNTLPTITSTPVRTVDVGTAYTYSIVASDANAGDEVTISLLDVGALPAGLTFTPGSAGTATIAGTPTETGLYSITVLAFDSAGGVAQQVFDLRVADPSSNASPTIDSVMRSSIQAGHLLLHQVDALDADGDPLSFVLTSAPTGMTIDSRGLIQWTPTASQINNPSSPYQVSIEVSDGALTATATYDINVINQSNNAAPAITSEAVESALADWVYAYQATAEDTDNDFLRWQLTNAPSGMLVDPNTGRVQWKPERSQVGSHLVTLRVSDLQGGYDEQTFTVTVRGANRPAMITSDPPIFGKPGETYTYQVEGFDPDGDPVHFTLDQSTQAMGVTVDYDTGLLQWANPTEGTYVINVRIADNFGLGVQQVYQLEISNTASNNAPVLTSSPDSFAEVGTTFEYNPVVEDPDVGDTIIYTLDVVGTTPTNSLSFNTSTGEFDWNPDAAEIGSTFAFRIKATDAAGAFASQLFYVTVRDANVAPVINSSPIEEVTAGRTYRYDVNATDANNDLLSYQLDATSVSKGMAIDSYGRITWETQETDIGTHSVSVTVTDERGLSADVQTFDLEVDADTVAPNVTVLVSQPAIAPGDQVTIQVRSDDEDVASLKLTVDGNEVPLSSDGIARITLSDPGLVTLVGTAIDHAGNQGTANGSVVVRDPNNAAPTISITSPDSNGTITEPTALLGSIIDPEDDLFSYEVSIGRLDGGEFRVIESVSADSGQTLTDIQQQALTVIDPTTLVNGTYVVRVEATDTSLNTSSAQRIITIDGALKLGNFNMSFVDLEVPVAGIPITITRSYDTLDADVQGDFGYGWNLDIATTKVDLTLQNDSLSGYGNYPAFRDGDRVVITLPDGTEEGFTFYAEPNQTVFSIVIDYIPKFVPDYGVTSELIVDTDKWLVKQGDQYVYQGTGEAYNPANPTFGGSYELKLRNGNSLIIDAETGELSTIYDTNNNAIYIDDYGIHSSTGRGVQFERDFANRISAIIDPAGNRIEYSYDADGNLVSVTDRVDATTEFTYLEGANAPPHYIDQVIDPYGRAAAKNVYDESGRLKQTIDADGKTIEYSWDGNTKIQHISDQLGNTTIIEVDARGNVIKEVGPEGSIMLRSYDEDDNQTSETVVIGEIDSPENGETNDLTTFYVYSDKGDLLETTDPRGNVTKTQVNEYGQPTISTDAFGNTTRTIYNSHGLPTSIIDADGQSTSFVFDETGNLTSARNDDGELLFTTTYNQFGDVTSSKSSSGRTVYFEYDTNGDQTATWYFVGTGANEIQILDLTEYDASRQATGTTRAILPTGEFVTSNFESVTIDPAFVDYTTSTTYDLNGNVTHSTDQFGFTSESIYDLRGQLIESRTESVDEDGNAVWLVSRSVYDAAGRQIASTSQYEQGTTDPISGSFTTYDAAGQVTSSKQVDDIVIDVLGTGVFRTTVLVDAGTTIYESSTDYDNAGRVVKTIDNYGFESLTFYNQFGDTVESRREAVDETGNTVWLVNRTLYNEKGQVTYQTDTYQEGSGDTIYGTRTIYDEQGRAVQSIRLSGLNIEMFDPDDDTTVADPVAAGLAILGSRLAADGTEISSSKTIYNEKGQVEKSVSADGQATEYEYDDLGRQVATVTHAVTAESVGLGDQYPGAMVRYRMETIHDEQGRVETERANLIQVEFADGNTLVDESQVQETSYQYDEFGQRTRTTLTDGSYMLMRYDEFGRTIAESTQIDGSINAVWSEAESSFIDDVSSEHVETKLYEYDAQGRLAAVELPAVADPDNGGTLTRPRYEYEYDARGNQTVIRDPKLRETRFTYDEDGRMLSRTLPLGYGADGIEGTADDSTLPEGNWTETFEYDDMGRQVRQTTFDGRTIDTIYDEFGRLDQMEYFAAGIDPDVVPADEVVDYDYDAFGRTIQVEDARGTIDMIYDDRGQLIEEILLEGTIFREYDEVTGQLTRMYTGSTADPVNDTHYVYDDLRRLSEVRAVEINDTVLATPEVTSYSYTLMGSLERIDYANGMIAYHEYDSLNRLELLTNYGSDATPEDLSDNPVLESFDYHLDVDGTRTGVTETRYDGGSPLVTEIDWTYDAADRLIQEEFDSHDDSLDFTATYTFDLVGNRLEKTVDNGSDGSVEHVTTYVVDANDRLLTETLNSTNNAEDRFTEFSYDADQQTGKQIFAGLDNSGTLLSEATYAYNLQGRLAHVEIDSDGDGVVDETIDYEYDHTGIRTLQSVNDGTNVTETKYLIDRHNHTGYQQIVEEIVNGALKRSYVLGHDVLSQADVGESSLTLLYDGHGSTRGLVDALGNRLSSQIYQYDAYGNPIGFDQIAALTTMLYSGEQFDSWLGMQYLRARYYFSQTGTFNRLDPYAGNSQDPQSFHKYLYTHGNPVMGIDPTGLFTIVGTLSSMSISSNSRGQEAQQKGGFFARRYANRPWTIHIYGKFDAELLKHGGIPWHVGIYAYRKGAPAGITFEVVTRSSDWLAYSGLGVSELKVTPTITPDGLRSKGYRLLPIAKHSDALFAWFAFAATAESVIANETQRIKLTLPFGYFGPAIPPWAINCTVWVGSASVTAVALSALPL
ncbi:putative Ig domain-containing protein [Bremerella alba]|uniref:Cadherin domain-containing protein n=1 Tax=Bremerella alba TaxID=980252 RepID=A0A7V8V4V8_9BACT|nr:putative Ig domain-containing protein [Bremerella alba]MBA2115003.1 hypothetical protein [Bremerella alba]